MGFPLERPRRLRRTPALRSLVRESRLNAGQMIHPAFVREGLASPSPIASMPGQRHESLDSLCATVEETLAIGLGGVLLFGLPGVKDAQGSGAFADDGIVQEAIRALRSRFGDACVIIADCCLCEYTDHGHCGFLLENGDVDNDATLELYARAAVSQASAGADIIAPSGMMDGQVAAIRDALDSVRIHRHGDPRLQREVRVGDVRAVPRRRRLRTAARRPPRISDGRREPARGGA